MNDSGSGRLPLRNRSSRLGVLRVACQVVALCKAGCSECQAVEPALLCRLLLVGERLGEDRDVVFAEVGIRRKVAVLGDVHCN